jgi:hypothetical protein
MSNCCSIVADSKSIFRSWHTKTQINITLSSVFPLVDCLCEIRTAINMPCASHPVLLYFILFYFILFYLLFFTVLFLFFCDGKWTACPFQLLPCFISFVSLVLNVQLAGSCTVRWNTVVWCFPCLNNEQWCKYYCWFHSMGLTESIWIKTCFCKALGCWKVIFGIMLCLLTYIW